ncbi:TetR/AcrR family transcriptional regulator [Pseudonocardia xinjiangensis]|uniref:TetR/AcrR family transcriptional regulator n=1 Tax=Pseudonocardia xinjiangensis TaxID=75289 RepID=UPI003D9096CA
MDRRAELAEGALDYVLVHGLVGLSLRPLAAALGTSDRMLIYHFGSKERLVGEVLALAQRRLAASLEPPGPDVRGLADLVHHLWAALSTPAAARVTRLYLEICVLAVQEPERFRAALERLRGPWRAPLQSGLVAFGIAPERAAPVADLILDTLDGLALDRLVATDPARVDAAAAVFAELLDGRYRATGAKGSA